MNKTIYLCGPIHGRSDADCQDWRTYAKEVWSGPTLDPMRRDARHRMKDPGIEVEIVEQDKKDIDQSFGVLVLFDQPSAGTSMEVLYAWERGKPVVIVNASGQPKESISLWLRYHARAIFDIERPTPGLSHEMRVNTAILRALVRMDSLINH